METQVGVNMAGVSDTENKEIAKQWIQQLKGGGRILDIGAGSGTYAKLAKREGETWCALEVFAPYVEMFNLKDWYDEIYIGDARYIDFQKLGHYVGYKLIIAADMLEHMEKEEAKQLIYNLSKHTKWLLICFPVQHMEQHAGDEGNEFETHVDHWTYDEMDMYLNYVAKLPVENKIKGEVLAYFLVKGTK